jgi:hypothetical protein
VPPNSRSVKGGRSVSESANRKLNAELGSTGAKRVCDDGVSDLDSGRKTAARSGPRFWLRSGLGAAGWPRIGANRGPWSGCDARKSRITDQSDSNKCVDAPRRHKGRLIFNKLREKLETSDDL